MAKNDGDKPGLALLECEALLAQYESEEVGTLRWHIVKHGRTRHTGHESLHRFKDGNHWFHERPGQRCCRRWYYRECGASRVDQYTSDRASAGRAKGLHVCRHVRENVVGSRQRRKWFDGILAIAQHGIHFMQECRGTICRRYAQDVVLLQVTGGQRTQLVSQHRGETIQILILISRSAWASAPQDRAGLSPERRDSEHPAPSNV